MKDTFNALAKSHISAILSKPFNAKITAIEEGFVTLECDGGDSVTIYNSGYTKWSLQS